MDQTLLMLLLISPIFALESATKSIDKCSDRYRNERAFLKTIEGPWRAQLLKCPATHKPYYCRFCHTDPFYFKITPNINNQQPSKGLYGYNLFDHHRPFIMMKKLWQSDVKDTFTIAIKKQFKPFVVRRLCLKTFAVKSVDVLFQQKRGKSKKTIQKLNLETQPGPDWFRPVCTNNTVPNRRVDFITLKFDTENPTFTVKDLLVLGCIPDPKKAQLK